jgi:hypothetical protein
MHTAKFYSWYVTEKHTGIVTSLVQHSEVCLHVEKVINKNRKSNAMYMTQHRNTKKKKNW